VMEISDGRGCNPNEMWEAWAGVGIDKKNVRREFAAERTK